MQKGLIDIFVKLIFLNWGDKISDDILNRLLPFNDPIICYVKKLILELGISAKNVYINKKLSVFF